MADRLLKGNRLWWFMLVIWAALAGILSSAAPGAKEFVAANKDAGLPPDTESIIADRQLEKYFPEEGGLPLFAVFSKESGLTDDEILTFAQVAEDLKVDKKYGDIETIPLSKMPPEVRNSFLSENKRTFFLPITLPENLEGRDLHAAVEQIKKQFTVDHDLKLSWTGPAGIAADAVELFSRADIVLLLSTVGLILVLLLIIYRSPLLTFIPLIGAAIVYTVVDKVIGLSMKAGLFAIDSQAVSIMTILLFAVVTDYSLLIFSRYREELRTHEKKDAAMRETMRHVKEPIFFSGSTIVLGVATLFFALYEPYRNFAPAFAIAAAFMLVAGLTLLPALFALTGRKAFWPAIPKFGDEKSEKKTIWGKMADKVTKRPAAFLIPIVLLLALAALNMTKMEESYDLIASFPEDLSSRIGYEQLGKDFSEGSLAPGTLLFVSNQNLDMQGLQSVIKKLEEIKGVDQVTAQGHPLSADGKSAKLSLIFTGNPYEHEALDAVKKIREKSGEILNDAGLTDTELFVAGESAKNADLRDINKRDTIVVLVLMIILISIMLGLQTRSIVAPLYMMGTILLSYAATIGLSLFLFKIFLGLDAISYRIPLYALVFLIALGVDYSIMLIARIREEVKTMPFADAVRRGVDRTGGVISSAGLILAATFLVLATMPIYELKLFGFIMALGILIDTFIVRPLLIPAILMLLGKWSFWPKRVVENKKAV
ncbi:MMPL family transporter [Siminovitchia fortis]|uniref:MMPL family transporter n=1 Tax=Siminovitchia fortis TaxID=254758 RepID=A0A443IZ12_9BACI|nr:MMPL family transporter [Siminovitchia fortis]RWR13515.1 MMPL family transporter [Siminovitchia fortis]WHY81756.1 MMPL family transporter [Siminovitchia fortis]